jgi:dephospho-CoA kinase
MYKVGLTGNYFSGQSEISKLFIDYQVKVFDANLLTKFYLNYSPDHIRKIKNYYGEEVYQMGLLNLSKFDTNSKFNELLDLVEFDLLKSYESFRVKYKNDFYTIFLYDFIFERNIQKYFNFNINCYRPRIAREYDLQYFGGLSQFHNSKILDNEMSDSSKNSKADYVIQNFNENGDYKSDIVVGLQNQILKVHKKIMSRKSSEEISFL